MTVADYLADHQAAMVEDLRAFVERESPSTDLHRVNEFAEVLAGYTEERGGTARIVEGDEGRHHVRAAWGSSGQSPVLLLGHFDTVWPVGTLDRMPFRIDAGLAYGPGIFDMKAGLVQGFWAVRALREVLADNRHIVFLCTSDEEIGSPTSRGLIETEAARALAVLVLEPSHEGALKTSRKGVAGFRVVVTGRAAHAGLNPEAGVSAVEELAHLIIDLHRLSDPAAGSTVSVGVVHGGTRPNVIAAEATAEVDVRFSSQSEAERLSRAILGLRSRRDGVAISVTGGVNRPPMERTGHTGALYERARSIAADLGFSLDEVSVGGGSDGNFCAAVGVPVLDGLGAVGAGAHAAHEHVVVDAMPPRAALVAGLIASM
jgi:glutamate carboxypeptidase